MPPRPATFSIVARDPDSDAVGVAVHSKFVSVGSVVPFASADAGAIATQSFANVSYGPEGLDLLREGLSAEAVIEELTEADEEAPLRQVGIVGQDGSVAAFTGEECFEYAGDLQGAEYTVQGNILANEETLEAMAAAFEAGRYNECDGADGEEGQDGSEKGTSGFPERLLAALRAGNEAGGDKRGEQSAALYVAKPERGYDGGNDRWIDVRVDDHDDPIAELERVFRIYDITLLEREEPDDLRTLSGETAHEVRGTLADLGCYDGEGGASESSEGAGGFDERDRAALEEFRAMNNFENHATVVLEDAIAHGWNEMKRTNGDRISGGRTDQHGASQERLIASIWHGLSRLERR